MTDAEYEAVRVICASLAQGGREYHHRIRPCEAVSLLCRYADRIEPLENGMRLFCIYANGDPWWCIRIEFAPPTKPTS